MSGLLRNVAGGLKRHLPDRWVQRLKRYATLPHALRSTREELLRVSLTMALEKDEERRATTCPICAATVPAEAERIRRESGLFNAGPLIRLRCPECDAVFGPLSIMNMRPERLLAEYKLLYSVFSEADTTLSQLQAFRSLNPQKTQRVLNYACGTWSRGISELLKEGYDVYGYEPSLPKQHPRIVTSLEELKSLSFDGLFSNNFIEHVQDPVAQLRDWKALLRPGGRMAHATACFEYLYDESPFHICYLMGRSLDKLCERVGMRVAERQAFNRGVKDDFFEVAIFEDATRI